MLVAVLADLVAGVPTLRKAWSHPETENATVFVLSGLNGVITLLTIDTWTPSTLRLRRLHRGRWAPSWPRWSLAAARARGCARMA